MAPRLLIVDRLLAGKPHADWKEGWELLYAYRDLGYQADIAGPDCPIPPGDITRVAGHYDLVIITENYPDAAWAALDWTRGLASIRTPKLFWAIDTHCVDYTGMVRQARIDFVACNNRRDVVAFDRPTFWLPYGASRRHHGVDHTTVKERDLVFVGGLTEERRRYLERFGIVHLSAFGADYVRAMQASRICWNKSIAYDINAKYFEIIGSGAFMLSNENEELSAFLESEDVDRMFWRDDDDLADKIRWFLDHEAEREAIAARARAHVLAHHSWEARAQHILDQVGLGKDRPAPPAA